MQDLEDEIGVDLLKRSPRGVTITAEGKLFLGKRLVYRSLAGINESVSVGIARAKNGDLTPAGEKFCEMLRKASKVANSRTTEAVEQNAYRERG